LENQFKDDYIKNNNLDNLKEDSEEVDSFIREYLLRVTWTNLSFFRYLESVNSIRSDVIFNNTWTVLLMKELYWNIFKVVEWFLYITNYSEFKTYFNSIYGNEDIQTCYVCQKLFKARKVNDKTCSKECSLEYKNITKIMARKKEYLDSLK